MNDMTAIVCDYAERIGGSTKTALAYYVRHDADTGNVCVLFFSGTQRWVTILKDAGKVTDFRLRNLPDTHPLYGKPIYKVRSVDTPKIRELQNLAHFLQGEHDRLVTSTITDDHHVLK